MSAHAWRAAALAAAYAALPLLARPTAVGAQPPPPPPDTRPARERAPVDLTGQWVSVITEDWRWRMVTPPVGDAASIPLNAAGRAATAAWDFAKDRSEGGFCKASDRPGLIRQPTRLRIDWQDADTLRLQFDAGNQTRLFALHAAAGAASDRSRAIRRRIGSGRRSRAACSPRIRRRAAARCRLARRT